MSFDIVFQPCRFGGTAVDQKNPFTAEVQPARPNEPLNAAEREAVRRVLEQATARGPDEQGCHVVELDDGGGAEVFADDIESGCMVALRGMTPGLSRFLYRLLQAGNWVMLPAMADPVAITTSPGSVWGIPDDFPRVVVCDSAEELAVLLGGGVEAWERYRDRVVDGQSGRQCP